MLTIDEVLEKALFDAKLISSSNFGNLKKIGWGRGSRTDKGVHASINTIKCNLDITKKYLKNQNEENMDKKKFRTIIDLNKIISDINSVMREDVRVFGLKYITKSFVVKNSATSRNYEYILPLDILKVGKFQKMNDLEFLKEINQFLQVFKGTRNYHNYTKKGNFKLDSSKRHILKISAEIFEHDFHIKYGQVEEKEENKDKIEVEKSEENKDKIVVEKNEENKDKIEIEKKENSKVLNNNVKRPYIRILLSGQSFIYNQIRKMVGSVIFVFQNELDKEFILNSFAENFCNIWLAPSEGLLLERILFGGYNKKQDIPMKLDLTEEENNWAREFKENCIYKSIIQENESKNVFGKWLEEKKYY